MLAVWEPRRSSCMSWPADVSKILMRVPCGSTNEQRHIHKTRAGLQILFFFHSKSCCWSVQLTLSDAVAIRVPCRFRAMQHSAPSWARMSTGGFSVLAKSTIWTWPEWVPGKASRELLLLGHSTQRPTERIKQTVQISDLNGDLFAPFSCRLTLWVVAGFEHMQLMRVVGEGEDFDHWVQDHYNPKKRSRLRSKQNEENSTHIACYKRFLNTPPLISWLSRDRLFLPVIPKGLHTCNDCGKSEFTFWLKINQLACT